MPIRISGMNSGLDTDSIVTALVSGYKTKKDKLVKAQTKLSWKQNAWKDVNTKVYGLYTSLDKMRLSSGGGYSAKKTTVSDPTKATVSAGAKALNGTQKLKIKQMATSGYITGADLGSNAKGSSKLSDLGFAGNGKITVATAKGNTDIDVDGDTTISSFVSKLKDAGVNASYDESNHRFFVSAKDSGAANDFTLAGADSNGVAALSAMGLNLESEANTATYKKFADYAVDASGNPIYSKDASGNYTLTGTYDEAKTRSNIEAVFNGLKDAHGTVSDKTTENSKLTRELDYAKAAKNVLGRTNGTDEASVAAKKADTLLDATGTYAKVDDGGNLINFTERTENEEGSEYKYTYKYMETVDNDDGTTREEERTIQTNDDYTVSTQLDELARTAGMITTEGEEGSETTDETAWNQFKADHNAMKSFKATADGDTEATDFMAEVETAVSGGTIDAKISSIQSDIDANTTAINNANDYINANATWDVSGIASMDDDAIAKQVETAMGKIATSMVSLSGGMNYSEGAKRVDGQDAKIELNGATFKSTSNKFEINGLTINATGTTAEGEEITITTASDTQAVYDKIKDFFTQYNEVLGSLAKSYNAASSKGFEPLTDEEKEQMSDTEVEKWEEKIKDSLLRRDQTLGSIMNTISSAMSKSYSVTMADGSSKNLSLSALGINTAGYFAASANDRYAFHIDGDSDDDLTSAKTDKLKAMIESDPDAVESLMKQVTQGLYESLDKKMKSSSLKSAYTIYNDKEMTNEYSSYTTQIKTWETRLSEMEDRYYKQFAAMEKALGTLNSNSSQLSGMLGG